MSNQHQHHRPRDSHGRQSFAKLPPRPDHAPPSRSNGNTESLRHPPSASSEKPLVIDLTGPPTLQSFSSQTTAVGTPIIEGASVADVPNGVAEAAKLYDGALCPKAVTQNSRSAKRLRFAAQAPPQSPQFIQPSKVYPATPPALPRGGATARQKQIQPQPTRSDFAKPNSRRDNKPKPYVLESPPSAQLLPDTSTHFPQWLRLSSMKKKGKEKKTNNPPRVCGFLSVERKSPGGSCLGCPGQKRTVRQTVCREGQCTSNRRVNLPV